jgi:hypothetical protein
MAITALGLQNHPQVQPFVIDGVVPPDFPHKIAVELIYRCDAVTQYRDVAQVTRPPPTVPFPPAPIVHASLDAPGPMPAASASSACGSGASGSGGPVSGAGLESASSSSFSGLAATAPGHAHASSSAPLPDTSGEPSGIRVDDASPLAVLLLGKYADKEPEANVSDKLAEILTKYRHEHFKKSHESTHVLSVAISALAFELPFAPFDNVVQPKYDVSARLLETLKGSGLSLDSIVNQAELVHELPSIAASADVDTMTAAMMPKPSTSKSMFESGHVFFRVVELFARGIASGPAAKTFNSDDVVVKMLPLFVVDTGSKACVVCEPSETKCHLVTNHDLTNTLSAATRWTRRGNVCYVIRDLNVIDTIQALRRRQ